MSNLSQFAPFAGGSGKLRYQEFTSSGTFTPSVTLLANGGQVNVMLVGGGQAGANGTTGASGGTGGGGGTVLNYVTTVSGAVSVTIGAGGASNLAVGGDTSFGSLVGQGAKGSSAGSTAAPSFNGSVTGSQLPNTFSGLDASTVIPKGINGYGGPGGAGGENVVGTGNATTPGANGIYGQVVFGNTAVSGGSGQSGLPGVSGGGAGGTSAAGAGSAGGAGAANTGGGGGGGGCGGVAASVGGAGGSGFVRVSWFE